MALYIKEFLFIFLIIIFIIDVKGEEEDDNSSSMWDWAKSFYDMIMPKCLPGAYLCPNDPTQCCPCPKGTSSLLGYDCGKCAAGTYADEEGSIYCNNCPAGTWSYSGASYCFNYYGSSKSEVSYN